MLLAHRSALWTIAILGAGLVACDGLVPTPPVDLPDATKDSLPALIACPEPAAPEHNATCSGKTVSWCNYSPVCVCGVCEPTYRCECRASHWQCEYLTPVFADGCSSDAGAD